MLKGYNLLGFTESAEGNNYLRVFSTVSQADLPGKFAVATEDEVNNAVEKAIVAFPFYKSTSPEARAIFLETIAEEIIALGDELIQRAMQESGLPEARLIGERGRTTGQLKLFAEVLREGSWVEAVIDTAMPDRKPLPRADLRKMLVPVGPVAVFGASNFPFAFSTAGGDTASALAAGNPVIVKAHESHLGTNELMASAINAAAKKCNLPDGVFSFVVGEGVSIGKQLVKHPGIKAIGFTGSYRAGMAIFKTVNNEREVPIPVYAEMSSINPVLLLDEKIEKESEAVAAVIAGSVTLGAGQFCTNPGLLFLTANAATEKFTEQLIAKLSTIPASSMLNAGICNNYYKIKRQVIQEAGVEVLYEGEDLSSSFKGSPALLRVNAESFINNPALQTEIFGPATLIVLCKDKAGLQQAIASLHGQLTGSIFGTVNDIQQFSAVINIVENKVGRIIYNSVPTGVEVCHAMVHGGPFPATTDARTTSVGADAIKRFARPVCFQDCPEEFLPDALKNGNPLQLMRKINAVFTKDIVQ